MIENKVSIIMPNFNCGQYIEAAIKSVTSQSYQNIELIIIDDGSFDNSIKIIDVQEQLDSRIKVLKNKRKMGPGYCRNIGINNATGRYITFLDSDDLYPRYRLESQLKHLQDSNKIICFGDYLRFKNRKVYTKNFLNKYNWKYKDLLGNPCLSIGTIMIDRKKILTLPKFPENILRGEDYYFHLALLKIVPVAIYIPRVYLYYRQRTNSTSRIGSVFNIYTLFTQNLKLNRTRSTLFFLKYIMYAIKKRVHIYFQFSYKNISTNKFSSKNNKIK